MADYNMINTDLEAAFAKDCKVINLKYEYPGFSEKTQWAIITDLTESEINTKYAGFIEKYMPYIVLTPEQGQTIHKFNQNEHKHEMRSKLFQDQYNATDELSGFFHPEMTVDNLFEKVNLRIWTEKLRIAIARLTPIQQRRVYAYYFQGKTMREIAEDEGVGFTKIQKSIAAAVEKLKKYLA